MILQPSRTLGRLEPGPVLVFGGPYSNLAATRAMLEKAARLGIDASRIICSGDLVAYCAEPEQVCRLIRETGIEVVMGNCEESLANAAPDCGCGFDEGMVCSALSTRWYSYSSQRVTQSTRQWMAALPRIIRFELGGLRFAVVHGAADQINRFVFESSDMHFKKAQIDLLGVDVVIGGHCGIPFGQSLNGRFWLNAGVIGLPANDATRSGWYLLLQWRDSQVEASWHRLDYDANSSTHSMLEAGLTDYADALHSGLWPSMDVLPQAERARAGQAIHLDAMILSVPDRAGEKPTSCMAE